MLTNPEELRTAEQKLEDAINRTQVIDLNYFRVKKLHDAEVAAIAELQVTKADLTTSIDNLEAKKVDLEAGINALQSKNLDIQHYLTENTNRLAELKSDIEKTSADYDSKKSYLAAYEESVAKRERDIIAREKIVTDNETSVIEKHAKITKFVQSL